MNLTAEEYWEWRTSISEMHLAEERQKSANLRMKLELLGLSQSVQSRKDEYEAIKSKIEQRLGINLNGKIIDNVSFEVKTMEESK